MKSFQALLSESMLRAMTQRSPILLALSLLGLSLGLTTAPARAETIAELEALSRASATPASGIALARRQIGSGALTDALATLERVLIAFPESREAQLLRAGVLCRLDDRAGSTAEFDQLRGRGVPDSALAGAIAECDALTRQRAAR